MNELLSKFQAEAERLARADRRAFGASRYESGTASAKQRAANRERLLAAAEDDEVSATANLLRARRAVRSR